MEIGQKVKVSNPLPSSYEFRGKVGVIVDIESVGAKKFYSVEFKNPFQTRFPYSTERFEEREISPV